MLYHATIIVGELMWNKLDIIMAGSATVLIWGTSRNFLEELKKKYENHLWKCSVFGPISEFGTSDYEKVLRTLYICWLGSISCSHVFVIWRHIAQSNPVIGLLFVTAIGDTVEGSSQEKWCVIGSFCLQTSVCVKWEFLFNVFTLLFVVLHAGLCGLPCHLWTVTLIGASYDPLEWICTVICLSLHATTERRAQP
jgi:hypothetical protein